MTYRGTVKDGVIVLEDATDPLPDGTEVTVTPAKDEEDSLPTLADRFKDFIGKVNDLPADMAENHDHYIHGTPKNQ